MLTRLLHGTGVSEHHIILLEMKRNACICSGNLNWKSYKAFHCMFSSECFQYWTQKQSQGIQLMCKLQNQIAANSIGMTLKKKTDVK